VITGAVFAATATVVTVAVALVAPAATVTEVGRVADGSLDVNVTVKPAGGA
jgi:nitrogen fixation/metabolism regulation signal transduction histidine kinase